MSDEIFNRQIEALKSELQRENDRHNRELSAIDNRKHSENDTHNKRKQNIQSRIERVKSNKKQYSNEDFLARLKQINNELRSLCEIKERNALLFALNR